MRVVGVDVGGTNTDAVLLEGRTLLSSHKSATTPDVSSGVIDAVRSALAAAPKDGSPIGAVMIGTTHFVNAVIQRSNQLRRVSVLRLCGPASRGLPPFVDFPPDLKAVIYGHHAFLNGGYEANGTPIANVDEEEVEAECQVLKMKGIVDIAISGIFSPSNPAQEKEVEAIVRRCIPNANITLSSDVGGPGLLERENAAILNASIRALAKKTIGSLKSSLRDTLGLRCPIFLTQNDGTLVTSRNAQLFPVYTFASGPTNSMRGAAFLTNLSEAIIIDIGGTTSDFGVLVKGFPRQASLEGKFGDVRTNFSMPDVLSIGLGGGSIVRTEGDNVTVGPVSVGFELTTKAQIFGGSTLTTTDIAIAAKFAESIEGADHVKEVQEKTDPKLIDRVLQIIKEKLEEGIDQMKTKKDAVDVILVGGGSMLLSEEALKNLKGAGRVIRPPHYAVANAIGAAIAQVGATVEMVYPPTKDREEALAELTEKAIDKAVENGADRDTVSIVSVLEVPASYAEPGTVKRRKKAVGDLSALHLTLLLDEEEEEEKEEEKEKEEKQELKQEKSESAKEAQEGHGKKEKECRIADYKPTIDEHSQEWIVSERDIEFIACGAAVLGTGGGGDPYLGKTLAINVLRNGGKIRVISPSRLKPDDRVVPVAFMGAPTVSMEKLTNGREPTTAMNHIIDITGPAAAIICAEVGGENSISPLVTGALLNLPIVDADGMGRAFPELQMFSPLIYGRSATPTAIADEKGNVVSVPKVATTKWLEELLRASTISMGGSSGVAFPPLSKDDVQNCMIHHSLSQAWHIGKAVFQAHEEKRDPIQAILDQEGGRILFRGTIVDVHHELVGGFNRGIVTIDGTTTTTPTTTTTTPTTSTTLYETPEDYRGKVMKVNVQNENIVATVDGKCVACVPDLITILDSQTGYPISIERVRYGLRVTVIAMVCSPIMRTETALREVGPAAFGYPELEYTPCGTYHPPTPILP